MLEKIILIHPTKCAGTTISKRLFKLKGFSDKNSAFYLEEGDKITGGASANGDIQCIVSYEEIDDA